MILFYADQQKNRRRRERALEKRSSGDVGRTHHKEVQGRREFVLNLGPQVLEMAAAPKLCCINVLGNTLATMNAALLSEGGKCRVMPDVISSQMTLCFHRRQEYHSMTLLSAMLRVLACSVELWIYVDLVLPLSQ